jgi:hypothetical protein
MLILRDRLGVKQCGWIHHRYRIIKFLITFYWNQEGQRGRSHRPSVGAVGAGVADPLEALVLESFAGAIDSVEKVGAVSSGWRCWHRWGFPSLAAPLSRSVRVRMSVGWMAARSTSYCEPQPPTSFIAMCDGAHQPCRVGRPRSGRENKAQRPLGLMVEDQF